MCVDSWGRPSYARAMIEVSSDKGLKEKLVVATPRIEGDCRTLHEVCIEYEWKPPHCSKCKIFGHNDGSCSKQLVGKTKPDEKKDADGFQHTKMKKHKGFNVGPPKPTMEYMPKPQAKSTITINPKEPSSKAEQPDKEMKKRAKEMFHSSAKGKGIQDVGVKSGELNLDLNKEDDASDVEEDNGPQTEFISKGDNIYSVGASTPNDIISNV